VAVVHFMPSSISHGSLGKGLICEVLNVQVVITVLQTYGLCYCKFIV